jgi:aminoglycoside 6'-N-acetyltransferase I
MVEVREVRLANPTDRGPLAALRVSLWPESSLEEQLRELDATLASEGSAILVALDESGERIGFLEAGLRSHADGCDTAQPVGFVEGWFVLEPFRHKGVGRALMRTAEDWARSRGCIEMASDALIDNHDGQQAHEALGFEVVDRCVHYKKNL